MVSQSRFKRDFAFYLDEIPGFQQQNNNKRFICTVNLPRPFGLDFVLLFIQGLLSVLERFMTMKGLGFESVTTVECKQKNMDYDTLAVY